MLWKLNDLHDDVLQINFKNHYHIPGLQINAKPNYTTKTTIDSNISSASKQLNKSPKNLPKKKNSQEDWNTKQNP